MSADRDVTDSPEDKAGSAASIEDIDRDGIVESYRGLVTDTAVKISERLDTDVAVDDMLGWGFRGLLEAYDRFSADERENTFSSFAYYRIRGAIYDGLRKSGWGTRGMACEMRDHLAINEYLESNFHANREAPTAKTFADSVSYLDEMVGNCVMICLVSQHEIALLQHKSPPSQQHDISRGELSIALQEALTQLDEAEVDVIKRHVLEDESLSSIAADLGYSKSWVSRMKARALDKLRAIIFGTSTEEGLLHGAEPDDFMTDR